MRPPARPRAAGTARPRPAGQGSAQQGKQGKDASAARGTGAQGVGAQGAMKQGATKQGATERESGTRAPAPARPGRPASGTRAPQRPPSDEQVPPSVPERRSASRPGADRPAPAGARDGVVSDQLADRLAERTAMARYRVWRRIGWTVAAVAAAAGLVWVAFFSPLLALDPEQVRVSGQGTTVDVGQVREAVRDEAGVPLPRIDTVRLREEILGMNAVKDVEITRAWPDGLAVALTSREPVAAVPQSGDVYALMDAEGVRVATVEEVPEGLPSIVVSLADGDAGHRAMDAALEVLGALPPRLTSTIKTVSAATQDDVRTTLADGRVIRWGSGAQVELKTKVAQTLLRAEPSARTIDVSSPGLPVTN